MKTPIEHIAQAQLALQDAQRGLKEPMPTIVDAAPGCWVVTAGSGGCTVRGSVFATTLNAGDMYSMHHDNEQNLVALRTSLSECIAQRDELQRFNMSRQDTINKLDANLEHLRKDNLACHTQIAGLHEACDQKDAVIENLQEFNDNQRRQIESIQKEMAAIHMCVTADSRTKLDDVVHQHGRELPFLLKVVYEAMDRYFSTEYQLRRLQGLVDKFTKETK